MLNAVRSLSKKTIIITGASRGIGKEIALRCAQDGANVVLLARSGVRPSHAALEGSLRDVKMQIEDQGGSALVFETDLRQTEQLTLIKEEILDIYGKVDGIVNNASAIDLRKAPDLSAYNLMMNVNARGTANTILTFYDELSKSDMKQVVTISPPLITLSEKWLYPHPVYTTSKYAMTMLTLGYSDMLRANTIWPKKLLATAATKMLEEKTGIPGFTQGRPASSFANVVYKVLCSDASGLSCLDSDLEGVGDGVDDIFIS